MNAIVLTDHFGNGGAERVASLLINGLSGIKGNIVHVCVFEDINNYNMERNQVIFHLLANPKRSHLVNSFLKIRNLTRVLKDEKPDAIFSFGPIMAGYVFLSKLLSGQRKIKIIDSERNDPRFEPVEKWKKCFRNFCYNHADVIVCQTPMAVNLLRNQFGIKTKTVIIPNPITPNLPTWKGINSKNIITACRLTEQKNLPVMIDAFEKLHNIHPDYNLVIYGDGDLRVFLEGYIAKKGLTNCIKLPGFANNIHEIMSNAYMYVSSSDYEGISNSMLEALGIGLPCVCTDCPVGGAGLYIKNGISGILVNVGDINGIYSGMLRLIEDRNFAYNISKSSRLINVTLSLDIITNKWIKLAE